MDETAPALQMYPDDTLLGEGDLLLEQLVRQPWYSASSTARASRSLSRRRPPPPALLRDLDAAEANR